LKAQVAILEQALASANDRLDFMEQDNAQAAAMRVEASRKWETEQDQIYAENEALKEEARVLRSQLAQEKDNVTHTWEKQAFARKNQVDQMLAEKEDNARKYQLQQSALQRQIDALLSEKQESTRNTRFLQNQQSALKNQVDQLRREKDDTTRSLQGQHSALQNQVNQLLREKEEQNQIFENQQSILRRQVDQLLQEKELNKQKWQQKETAFQIQMERRDEVVQHLTNITQQLKESTQKIDLATSSRTSKSTSGRSTKRKSSSRNDEHDLPSKVMKQAQSHMDEIQAASVDLHSNHQQSSQKINTNKKDRAQFQALDFNLHQEAFGQNLQQPQNAHITAPREQDDDTQISQQESVDENHNIEGHQNHAQISDDDSISDVSTNWSSILGHGFIPDIHQHLRKLKANNKRQLAADDLASAREDTIQSGRSSRAKSVKVTAEQHAVRDDTFQTIQSGRSSHAPSVKGTGGILKNSNAPNLDDLTGRFSIKSARSNGRTEQDHTSRSNTHRRHRSLVEEDHTTKSNTSHRRHHSETTIHTSTRRQTDGDDMTSAYLIADIDAAKQSNGKERPVLSATARQVLDGLCEHNRKNCTICLRLASFDTKLASKTTIQIQKPVPVSQRAPSPVPYEDEPTLRPAVAPGVALATVLKGLEDEVAHLKMKHSEVQQAYMEHDASLGRRERKAMKAELESLLGKIESKSDQIYALYDVLEGQKQAGQEMSVNQIEVTLNKMDLNVEDEDEELPWEGIEESN
jgi:Centrosome microtubule-binding domain of Cep57